RPTAATGLACRAAIAERTNCSTGHEPPWAATDHLPVSGLGCVRGLAGGTVGAQTTENLVHRVLEGRIILANHQSLGVDHRRQLFRRSHAITQSAPVHEQQAVRYRAQPAQLGGLRVALLVEEL